MVNEMDYELGGDALKTRELAARLGVKAPDGYNIVETLWLGAESVGFFAQRNGVESGGYILVGKDGKTKPLPQRFAGLNAPKSDAVYTRYPGRPRTLGAAKSINVQIPEGALAYITRPYATWIRKAVQLRHAFAQHCPTSNEVAWAYSLLEAELSRTSCTQAEEPNVNDLL